MMNGAKAPELLTLQPLRSQLHARPLPGHLVDPRHLGAGVACGDRSGSGLNGTLALAGWNLLRQQRRLDELKPASPPAPAAAPEP
jgi:hypothetical protein